MLLHLQGIGQLQPPLPRVPIRFVFRTNLVTGHSTHVSMLPDYAEPLLAKFKEFGAFDVFLVSTVVKWFKAAGDKQNRSLRVAVSFAGREL